jgi:glucose/mannose-6-phosphate isomerase
MLDDLNYISKIDKSNQIDKLEDLPNNIIDSIKIADSYNINKIFKVDNIIFCGMGGSAIAGDFIKVILRNRFNIPIYVNRSYSLPKWANKNTLVFSISYSGNTEETLKAYKNAYQKKCKIISISSGGKLEEYSLNRGLDHIKIPSGFIPRGAIAYFLFISLKLLEKIGLLNNVLNIDIDDIKTTAESLIKNNNKKIPEKDNPSKNYAKKILNTIPQIYGWDIYNPVARRWSTQFNENSKVISKFDMISEANHNDIVGWSQNPEISKKFSCFIFRDKDLESIYMSTRLNFMKILYSDVAANFIEIQPCGKNIISKIIYTTILGDYISNYLAVLRKVDPTPVSIIEELKEKIESI